MYGNRILVGFLKTRTEAKRSNTKFRFPWLFSKPNLSHTNSQYLSHSHRALTFFALRTLSDSKWSWNLGLENRRPKCKMHTQERQFIHFFLYFTTDLQRRLNWQFFQNRTRGFSQNRTWKIHSAHPNYSQMHIMRCISVVGFDRE